MPEALRSLRLGLNVHGLLLVNELVLICTCDIVIRVVIIFLYQFDDLFCIRNWMIVSFLLIGRSLFCIDLKLKLMLFMMVLIGLLGTL